MRFKVVKVLIGSFLLSAVHHSGAPRFSEIVKDMNCRFFPDNELSFPPIEAGAQSAGLSGEAQGLNKEQFDGVISQVEPVFSRLLEEQVDCRLSMQGDWENSKANAGTTRKGNRCA